MDKNKDKDEKKDKKKDDDITWKLKKRPLVLFSIIGTVLTIVIIIIGIMTIYLTKTSSNNQLCLYGVAKNGNCNQPCNYIISVNDDNGDCKPIHNKKGDDGDV